MGSCASSSQVANVVTSTKSNTGDVKKNAKMVKPEKSSKSTVSDSHGKAEKVEKNKVTALQPPHPQSECPAAAAPGCKEAVGAEENGNVRVDGPAPAPGDGLREGSTLTDVVSQTQLVILTDQISGKYLMAVIDRHLLFQ